MTARPAPVRTGPVPVPRVAVIGAGMAGAACAAGLRSAGLEVTVFDKSAGVGGRMATRRAAWVDAAGTSHPAVFDHGCAQFSVTRSRFRFVVDQAVQRGAAVRWRQWVAAPFPAAQHREVVVPAPDMPALVRHLLGDMPLRTQCRVTGLRRAADGWHLAVDTAAGRVRDDGPFDRVVLALPPAQAAPLLADHRADWAGALAAVPVAPCWTLMAVTGDVDWPWDAALVDGGPLNRVARNDRRPGRAWPDGRVPWVAQATAAWSLLHLEDDPADVAAALRDALAHQLPNAATVAWHHCSVHRWRHARHGPVAAEGMPCFWDEAIGLGVCGDAFGAGNVEAAWHSGDELAGAIGADPHAAAAAPARRGIAAAPGLALGVH